MNREQQSQFIKDTLYEFRDGVVDIDDAVRGILEAMGLTERISLHAVEAQARIAKGLRVQASIANPPKWFNIDALWDKWDDPSYRYSAPL